MIYECDKCGAALPPHAKVCPKCGFVFQGTVPADADMPGPADPPKPGFTPRVPRPPPGLHLHGASSRWARMERPFAKVLVCLAALHLLVGAFGAYIAAAYDLPQGFGSAPNSLQGVERFSGTTIVFSVLPTLILISLWIIALSSVPPTRHLRRWIRPASASVLFYSIGWILLTGALLLGNTEGSLFEFLGSAKMELVDILCILLGALLNAIATIGRLRAQ